MGSIALRGWSSTKSYLEVVPVERETGLFVKNKGCRMATGRRNMHGYPLMA